MSAGCVFAVFGEPAPRVGEIRHLVYTGHTRGAGLNGWEQKHASDFVTRSQYAAMERACEEQRQTKQSYCDQVKILTAEVDRLSALVPKVEASTDQAFTVDTSAVLRESTGVDWRAVFATTPAGPSKLVAAPQPPIVNGVNIAEWADKAGNVLWAYSGSNRDFTPGDEMYVSRNAGIPGHQNVYHKEHTHGDVFDCVGVAGELVPRNTSIRWNPQDGKWYAKR